MSEGISQTNSPDENIQMLTRNAVLVLCGLWITYSASPAYAGFAVRIYGGDGAGNDTLLAQIFDNNTAISAAQFIDGNNTALGPTDASGVQNRIGLLDIALGGFDMIVESAQSNTPSGNPALLLQQITAERLTSQYAVLRVVVSANNYSAAAIENFVKSDGTINDAIGNTFATFESWVNQSNLLFDTGYTPGAVDLTELDHKSGVTGVISDLTSFSMTNEMVLSLQGSNQVSVTGDSKVAPTPEPGTMALLALGGVTLVGARMRRRKAEKVTAA